MAPDDILFCWWLVSYILEDSLRCTVYVSMVKAGTLRDMKEKRSLFFPKAETDFH